ncbi:MAG: Ig-like domain-containing protein [Chitinophagales bacterium]|nr:gliding motility-associated C-terminal domain-containing protein [Bacteroidota bacterium]MCB9043452.1 gliding motility-associated C-terminal domain-containing protein [Chitinophagales bacterium]
MCTPKYLQTIVVSVSVLFFLLQNTITAQNLVSNSSFETYSQCPNNQGQISYATGWGSANAKAADYFNGCNTAANYGVPQNVYGTAPASNGSAYAGVFAFGEDDLRSYITAQLQLPLTTGELYCVSFDAHIANLISYKPIQELGAYFSLNAFPNTTSTAYLNVTPQIYNISGLIDEDAGWYNITGTFVADFPYQYITIGNFFNNANTTGGATIPGTPFASQVYYYIDNVHVENVPQTFELQLSQADFCENETITVYVSGAGANEYNWYLANNPDSLIYTGSSLTLTPSESMELLVRSAFGACEVEKSITLNPAPIPIAGFTFDTPCVGGNTLFYDVSEQVLSDAVYEWDFLNDGTVDATTQGGANYVFEGSGTFPVKLTVSNNSACFDEVVLNITVNQNCNPCSVASNFVPNPYAEFYEQCPDDLGQIAYLSYWYNPTQGSPDYFNACFNTITNPPGDEVGVPQNVFGNQEALSGNGYMGCFMGSTDGTNFREYVGTPLQKALLPGKSYCVKFKLALADFSDIAIKDIGAFFSKDSLYYSSPGPVPFYSNIPQTPQVAYNGEDFLTQNDWVSIEGNFVAQDTLHWLIIGNFKSENESDYIQVKPETFGLAYYYIEDVQVVPSDVVIIGDTLICQGETAVLQANGLCNYSWTLGETELSNTAVLSAKPSETTTYLLTGDNGVCSITTPITINVVPQPQTIADATICPGDSIQLYVQNAGVGVNWSPTESLSDSAIVNPWAMPSQTTTYTAHVTYSEENACSNTDQVTITVTSDYAEAGEGGYVCSNSTSDSLQLNASGGNVFAWTPANGLSNTSVANPLAFPDSSTWYFVEVINSETTCSFIDSVLVEVFNCDLGGPSWVDTTDTDPPTIVEVETVFDTLFINTIDTVYLPSIQDPDGENDGIIISILTPPEHGTAFIANNDSLVYTPDNNFIGIDFIQLLSCDTLPPIQCDTLNVVIVVQPVEDSAPIISLPNTNNMAIDTLYYTLYPNDVLEQCFDVIDLQGDDFNIVISQQPTEGELSIFNAACIEYTAPSQAVGVVESSITACDENDNCQSVWLFFDIVTQPMPPYFVHTTDSVFQGTPLVFCPEIIDPNGDAYTIDILEYPANGTAELLGDSCFQYISTPNFNGIDTLQIIACDVNLYCDTSEVYIYVLDHIVAIDDYALIEVNETVTIPIIENDIYPVISLLEITSNPQNGTFVLDNNYNLTYQPFSNFSGNDTLQYQLCSLGLGCDTATVFITIAAPGNPPTAIDDAYTTEVNTPLSMDVLSNDIVPGGATVSIFEVVGPYNGSAEIIGEQLYYFPDLDFVGTDSLTYMICIDGTALCSTATVVITVGVAVDCVDLFIPDAFSPNNDGWNERFEIPALENCANYAKNKIKIFNRWGNVVFEKNNYGTDGIWWDGTWQENNENLPEGTYFYLLEIDGWNQKDFPRGALELFR